MAMAMFVLVVDTSLMNVSISAVVRDLGATASGVQGAIALEALVSAAFILIGGKTGDLIGRKRAYLLGLVGYAIGVPVIFTFVLVVVKIMASDISGVSLFGIALGVSFWIGVLGGVVAVGLWSHHHEDEIYG